MTAQLAIDFDQSSRFVQTRARRNDCQTSKDAAKAAITRKADSERVAITAAVKAAPGGLTAREAAWAAGIDYIACQRRIKECGMTKTDAVRDGCRVWVAV